MNRLLWEWWWVIFKAGSSKACGFLLVPSPASLTLGESAATLCRHPDSPWESPWDAESRPPTHNHTSAPAVLKAGLPVSQAFPGRQPWLIAERHPRERPWARTAPLSLSQFPDPEKRQEDRSLLFWAATFRDNTYAPIDNQSNPFPRWISVTTWLYVAAPKSLILFLISPSFQNLSRYP